VLASIYGGGSYDSINGGALEAPSSAHAVSSRFLFPFHVGLCICIWLAERLQDAGMEVGSILVWLALSVNHRIAMNIFHAST
jgi:hypothetical protein